MANKRGNSLSRIDLVTGQEDRRVETCGNPHELAVSPDGEHVALACYGGSQIEIFTTDDLSADSMIQLGEGARPHGVVWHENGTIVATAEGRGTLFTVTDVLGDVPQVTEIGESGDGPHMVVVDQAGTFAWGTILSSGTVVRYDLAAGTETARRDLGGETEAIALSLDGKDLWVGANSLGRAFRLDPHTLELTGEVRTGTVPIRLATHPSDNTLVSSNFGNGSLTVIGSDPAQVIKTIAVSSAKDAEQITLLFSAEGDRLYIAETGRNMVAELDYRTGEVLRRLPTGEGGDGLALIE